MPLGTLGSSWIGQECISTQGLTSDWHLTGGAGQALDAVQQLECCPSLLVADNSALLSQPECNAQAWAYYSGWRCAWLYCERQSRSLT